MAQARDVAKPPSRPRQAVAWTLSNWDTVLTLAAATVFAVLSATSSAPTELVRGVTLAVLALLAITMIRLRSARDETQAQVDDINRVLVKLRDATDGLRGDMSAMESGAPWRALDSTVTWDMKSREVAHYVKRRRLHFYRNDVVVMHDWFSGDGKSSNETANPGRFLPGDEKLKIDDREYSLVFLRKTYRRGDEQTFVITRDLEGAFPDDNEEYVAIDVLEETEKVTVKAIWPRDKPPTRVWIQGKDVNVRQVPLADLDDEPGTRKSYSYELRRPKIGDDFYIFWNW